MAEKSEWDGLVEKTQEDLAALGVEPEPRISKLVAEIRNLGAGPQAEARAKLDLVITREVIGGIGGLVQASEALVRSSDENTTVMSSLASRLNWLTFGLLVFSGAQVWLAFRHPPQPINVSVPAPVVQVVPPVVPSPQQSPVPAVGVHRNSSPAVRTKRR